MHKIAIIPVLLTVLLCTTASASDCSKTSTGNTPLYPSIFVSRSPQDQSAALAAVNSIPAGPTVLLGIGMSNAKRVWDQFANDAAADPLKNPDLLVVNGAIGGGSAAIWAIEDHAVTWGELDETLADEGVTKQDVTVLWFMTANLVGNNSREAYSANLESDVRTTLDLAAIEFPNLKIVWLQSMIYAGYSSVSGNFEPYAYESGFVAQRLLVDQSWPFFVGYGPYLWADGTVPRDDGLTWLCADFADDGNHPGPVGITKHANYLTQFFHEDSIASIGYLDTTAMATVPDVVALDQANAELSIVSASLVVGTVSSANSDTVLAGNVISQSPTGGSSVALGTAVDLVVSLGPLQLTTVPDVVALDQANAELSIVSASLVVGTVSSANSDTVLAGNVISQSPTGGSSVALGTAVDLVVSLGPLQLTTVPDVVALDQANAELSIVSASLVVGTVSSANSDTVLAGNVISQSPTGGSSVALGTAVDLVVSLGPLQLTTVPDVVALDQANAELSIVSASLVVGTVSSANSDTVLAGNVISQSPTGGSSVALGTAVDLVVSLGPGIGVPMLILPVDGSVLSGSSETFTWSSGGAVVDRWRLEVGTTPDGTDLFVQGLDATITSTLVSGLPTDGSTVYVNLKWRISGVTGVASYVYTANGGAPGTPAITSPAPGSTLPSSNVTFSWTGNGEVADDWQLLVGTSAGDNTLFDSGVLPSTTTSAVVGGLPEDSSTIHVALRWTDAGNPSEVNYTYSASSGGASGVPVMVSPPDGSTLTASSETFTWSAEGAAVDNWRLEVGTTPGGRDLFIQGLGSTTTSLLVSGLPTDGSVVYVNLRWRIAGVGSVASYVYTASGSP